MKNAERLKPAISSRTKKKPEEKGLLHTTSSDTLIPIQTFKRNLVFFNQNNINPLFSNTTFNENLAKTLKHSSELFQNNDILNYYKIKLSRNSEIEPICTSFLQFDSNFESGNLLKAYQHSEKEFVLVIREDFSNQNYSHWFYFSVKAQKLTEVTFHVVNVQKLDSALAEGMQIVAKFDGKWQRAGKNVKFRKNTKFKEYVGGQKAFSLSFSFDFCTHGKVFFAYTYPYTYSDLEKLVGWVKRHKEKNWKIETLCKSLSGLDIPVITITNSISSENPSKKSVVFIGRVHPCEAPSSFIISGLIHYLLSSSDEVDILRNTFIFIIIPMINPDGVRYGNSRCSLLGIDLNRRWSSPIQSLHPEVFHTKKMIEDINSTFGVFLCCDIHSHAKKKNVFMYGCNSGKTEKFHKEINLKAKVVPMLLAKSNAHFSLKDSHFKMDKSKESTARIVMFKQLGIVNSYTVETSFWGSEFQKIFEIHDWEKIGEDLAKISLALLKSFPIQCVEEKISHKVKKSKAFTPKQKGKFYRIDGYTTPLVGKVESDLQSVGNCEKRVKVRLAERILSSRGRVVSRGGESDRVNGRPMSTMSEIGLRRILQDCGEKGQNRLPNLR